MKENKLNSRQWLLYNFLKERCDQWTTQKEIALALPETYPTTVADMQDFHNCSARHTITNDIRTLNKSGLIQKTILSGSKGIKIANEAEWDTYIGQQINAAVRRLKYVKSIAAKGNRDGQMRIVFGSERDTVKAFIDSDKDVGARLREARLFCGLTAVQVVEQLGAKGIDAPMLSRFEKGYCLPNKTTLANLALIYGVTADWLLTGICIPKAENSENNGLQAVKKGV